MPLRRRREPGIRVLCYVNHYFGSGSAFVGKSATADPGDRERVVQQTLGALRELPFDMDVRVCGVEGSSLVPLDEKFPHLGDPRHLVYAGIERMFSQVRRYDYFLNVEDDILVSGETLETMVRFHASSELNEVYLPNRLETGEDGAPVCVDQLAMPGWLGLRREFEGRRLDVGVNPHSAMFFLSRAQLEYATTRVDLRRREQFLGGYMASAYANVHSPFLLWRSVEEPTEHSVIHLDRWLHSPGAEARADHGAPEVPIDMGHVDSVEIHGLVCTIRGWATTASGRPLEIMGVRLDTTEMRSVRVVREERPDVVGVYPWASPSSGFTLTFSLLDLPEGALDARALAVVARGDGSGEDEVVELVHPPQLRRWPVDEARQSVAHAPQIADEPGIPDEGARRLARLLADARCYLEYGTGGTTLLARRLGVESVVAVESDPSWAAAVASRLDKLGLRQGTEIVVPDIGPTGPWGYPATDAGWRRYWRYPLEPWDRCQELGLLPDVVLVDGRFRVACMVATLMRAQPGTVILFDDYRERPDYHVVERFLEPVAYHDRVAEFVVPDRPWDPGLAALLVEAVTEPH